MLHLAMLTRLPQSWPGILIVYSENLFWMCDSGYDWAIFLQYASETKMETSHLGRCRTTTDRCFCFFHIVPSTCFSWLISTLFHRIVERDSEYSLSSSWHTSWRSQLYFFVEFSDFANFKIQVRSSSVQVRRFRQREGIRRNYETSSLDTMGIDKGEQWEGRRRRGYHVVVQYIHSCSVNRPR